MKFFVDPSLEDIGDEFQELVESERKYTEFRTEKLVPILNQVKKWKKKKTPVEKVRHYQTDTFIVTDEDKVDGFTSYFPYIGDIFDGMIDDWGRFSLGKQKLKLSLESSIANAIEKLRYNGLRRSESLFYQQFLKERLGEDFKGIFLFSAGDPTDFATNYQQNEPKLGHWDYLDTDFSRDEKPLDDSLKQPLLDLGITNPEKIPKYGGMWVPKSDDINHWKAATRTNKSTRLIGWFIGSDGNMSKETKLRSYDLALAQSDQSTEDCAPNVMYNLVRNGGYLVMKSLWLDERPLVKNGSIKPLLLSPEGDYSLYENVSG